ncbi:Fpg/Nei family DNA glycosylase [Stackebrandtia soli]|uniref:Fpg/Nei family DNA glycosylase n=1 Tax=Stackebrandtia soli TaxID=1892856 RepID=UPI0039E98447
MPELPEVEALAAMLRRQAVGHAVARADAVSIAVLKTYDPSLTALVGENVTDVDRSGKFLDLTIGGLHLVIHLARAGWLRWQDEMPTGTPRQGRGPTAFRLVLDDGAGFDLTEAGTKKSLAVYLVADPTEIPGIAALGVDPFDGAFDVSALRRILNGNTSRLKTVLRDQKLIAGIGNAYSDEILHAAKLSPYKTAADVTGAEAATLHDTIVRILADAATAESSLPAAKLKAHKRSTLRVHGREGERCEVCGDAIRSVNFADSSFQYCPTCQTDGKILADRRMSRLLK